MNGIRRWVQRESSQQAAITRKDCSIGSSAIGLVLRIALEARRQQAAVGKSRELERLEIGIEPDGRGGRAVRRKVQDIDLRLRDTHSGNLIETAISSGRKGI